MREKLYYVKKFRTLTSFILISNLLINIMSEIFEEIKFFFFAYQM